MSDLAVTLPEPSPEDDEDVVWGLSTASALWARGERKDAVVWLRRASEAATAAGQDFRASQLGMYATEIEDALNNAEAATEAAPQPVASVKASTPPAAAAEAPAPVIVPPAPPTPIVAAPPPPKRENPWSRTLPVTPSAATPATPPPRIDIVAAPALAPAAPSTPVPPAPHAAAPPPPPAAAPPPPAAAAAAPAALNIAPASAAAAASDAKPVRSQRSKPRAPILDPWSDQAGSPPDQQLAAPVKSVKPAAPPPPPRAAGSELVVEVRSRATMDSDEDVVTSAAPLETMAKKPAASARAAPPPPPPPARSVRAPLITVSEAAPAQEGAPPPPAAPAAAAPLAPTRPTPPAASAPPPAHAAAAPPIPVGAAAPPVAAPPPVPVAAAAPPVVAPPPVPVAAAAPPVSIAAAPEGPPPGSLGAAGVAVAAKKIGPPSAIPPPKPTLLELPPEQRSVGGVLLEEIPSLADLPHDAQAALASVAKVERIGADEEIAGFGAALLVEGAASVCARLVDVPAVRAVARTLVPSRGSLEDGLALRVVAAEGGATIVVWSEAVFSEALSAFPWVLDEIHDVADRLQALAGLTMGPLGDLDEGSRATATDRMTVRGLAAGEVFLERGAPTPGILVVGAGSIDLVAEDGSTRELTSGDFLFASAALDGGPATETARAGQGGALLLVADRKATQALFAELPQLIEIFGNA